MTKCLLVADLTISQLLTTWTPTPISPQVSHKPSLKPDLSGRTDSKENVSMAFLTSTTGALSRSTLAGSAIFCIKMVASDSHREESTKA